VSPDRLTFLGHSTVLIELGGARLLTDPVLRPRILHLRRHAPAAEAGDLLPLDGVLISHLHHDHLDIGSLRGFAPGTPAVVPVGGGGLVRRAGIEEVHEVSAGDRLELGAAAVQAVPARHRGERRPLGGAKAAALGYVAEGGGRRVYFAGDTGLFDEMEEIGSAGLDCALVPVWGWGTTIGEGHLGPESAARALRLLRPRVAVPIHWGGLFPIGQARRRPHFLTDPPRAFAHHAARIAPEVEVRILQPGESADLG
jgi:L-ascorbate metabolism protein UlaG (beta-lactamase superfamily)